jgi:hypothetical protein
VISALPPTFDVDITNHADPAGIAQQLRDMRVRAADEYAALQASRAAADASARELLFSYLTDEQRCQYREHDFFDVMIDHLRGYRIYVNMGISNNIVNKHRQSIGRPWFSTQQYCIHPTIPVPRDDTFLAQMLMIMHDEERFLYIANMRSMRPAELFV